MSKPRRRKPVGPRDSEGASSPKVRETKRPRLRDKWWPLGPIEAFTIVLAFFAAIQGWAFVASERASVLVTGFQFQGGLQPDQAVVATVGLKNSGHSTAHVTGFDVTFSPGLSYPRKYLPLTRFAFNDIPAGSDIMGVFNATNMDGSPRKLDAAELAAVNSGLEKLFLFGYVEFTDSFWPFPSLRSEFCYVYDPAASGRGVTMLNACPSQ